MPAGQEYTVIRLVEGSLNVLLVAGAYRAVVDQLKQEAASGAANSSFVSAEVEVAIGWTYVSHTFRLKGGETEMRTINLANVMSIGPAKLA